MKTIKQRNLKYDTSEKRIAAVKRRGNVITFLHPIFPNGTANKSYMQIAVTGFEKDKNSAAVKIIGFGHDSPWYNTIEELIDAVDWNQMETWHSEA